MDRILNFKNFNKKLYVFDFDDTLVKTPSFEEISLKYIRENTTVKDLLSQSLVRISRKVDDLEYENGGIFINDPEMTIKPVGNWVRRGKRVYLTTPDIFSYIDESLPTDINEDIVKLYNSVENKCIITARPEGSREIILSSIKKIDLELPKYGLHMRPDGLKNAGEWKGVKMVELVKKYGFSSVVFYDDNAKYIKKARTVFNRELPDIRFDSVKI